MIRVIYVSISFLWVTIDKALSLDNVQSLDNAQSIVHLNLTHQICDLCYCILFEWLCILGALVANKEII